MDEKSLRVPEVTIIGVGLAGLAASIHLAKAGVRTICIEASVNRHQFVGESLDWSSPDLLSGLGFPMEQLVDAQISTYKRHVTLKMPGGQGRHYLPSEWLSKRPFKVELRTLHVDRAELYRTLLGSATACGVEIVEDKVTRVNRQGNRITSVETASGIEYASRWFIDASGHASSLLARGFKLPSVAYGPRKVAIWRYFKVVEPLEGTTVYIDPLPRGYTEWVWEIPINPNTISVGYVLEGKRVKAARQRGLTADGILKERLRSIPRFNELVEDCAEQPAVTSFECRTYKVASGANWVIAGEAASMVDPLTSNGVTSALRHARESAELIIRYRRRHQLPWVARICYNGRVRAMGLFFNSTIEKIVYDWPIRDRIGLPLSGDVYTIPAWLSNLLYTRTHPTGPIGTWLFTAILNAVRAAFWAFHRICRYRSVPAQRDIPVLDAV
jgi:flavin-dependent dehydrogenase